MDEAKIIKKAKEGNKKAMISLFEEFKDEAFYLCYIMLQDENEAQKAALLTFDALFANIADLKNGKTLGYALAVQAARQCRKLLMKKNPGAFKQIKGEKSEICEDFKGSDNVDINEQTFKKLCVALSGLPEMHRIACVLFCYADFKASDIAYAIKISENSSAAAVNRCCETLKKTFFGSEKLTCAQLGAVLKKGREFVLAPADYTGMGKALIGNIRIEAIPEKKKDKKTAIIITASVVTAVALITIIALLLIKNSGAAGTTDAGNADTTAAVTETVTDADTANS